MDLYPTTVTIEAVSQLEYGYDDRNNVRGTCFNFVENGRHQYWVSMYGKVKVCKGMTVTAVLTKPENWQTVRGWVDHETGEISGVQTSKECVLTAGVLMIPFLFMAGVTQPILGGPAWQDVFLCRVFFGACILGAAFFLRRAWQAGEIIRQLHELSPVPAYVTKE